MFCNTILLPEKKYEENKNCLSVSLLGDGCVYLRLLPIDAAAAQIMHLAHLQLAATPTPLPLSVAANCQLLSEEDVNTDLRIECTRSARRQQQQQQQQTECNREEEQLPSTEYALNRWNRCFSILLTTLYLRLIFLCSHVRWRWSLVCDILIDIAVSSSKATNHDRRQRRRQSLPGGVVSSSSSSSAAAALVLVCFCLIGSCTASAPDTDKADRFLDKININEQSIAAVFNKVAYGSTTKRSIPDNVYLYTTLATPLLTTYRYSDGNQEWYRVDVKEPEPPDERPTEDRDDGANGALGGVENAGIGGRERNPDRTRNYGSDLEKDHALPTSAPAADILKNNNNKNYNNPNRYNNDRMRPDQSPPIDTSRYQPQPQPPAVESVTEREPLPRTSTGYSVLRNVRPTKSMFGKEVPSYVPPSRSFFTPPLPPEYLNPFADKPTLRGTNSDSYQNRRPIPPPSLMPKKDRIPFRPDLPPSVSENAGRNDSGGGGGVSGGSGIGLGMTGGGTDTANGNIKNDREQRPSGPEQRKKTLNTPSQNVHLDRLGEFYGLNRLHNESNFEYEPIVSIPSISRILSGSNGRKEDIPDILLRTVTATPNHRNSQVDVIRQKTRHEPPQPPPIDTTSNESKFHREEVLENSSGGGGGGGGNQAAAATVPKNSETQNTKNSAKIPPHSDSNRERDNEPTMRQDTTTSSSDIMNLPNVKIKSRPEEVSNATKAANGHEIWHICWNVHVYLVVFLYVLLAVFSIIKLIRFERETHMFSKSYFLAVHLLLTAVCVLRIFYLAYDPYNVNGSFSDFTYDLLHNLPLSLLATTFAVLIVFLLKRTLNHLKVKTRPVFLVLFGLGHIFLCFCLNLAESFDLFSRASVFALICRFVYILLCWSLGLSYVYLYKIIKNVLAKKSQNLSEMCTQNISYASHITIAVALLFTLLGFVQLYGLFFIKVDRFTIPYHWILWGFELSVRVLEITIITLLAIVVSLRMSQREKQNVGFPLFPCTTSDSSTDNIYPNNCSTNLNALNYSLRSSQAQYRPQQQQHHQQDLALENIPTDIVERPNLLLDKKSTLDRCFQNSGGGGGGGGGGLDRSSESASEHERGASFERFERPSWAGSQRFPTDNDERFERDNFPVRNFERSDDLQQPNSGHFERSSGRFPSGHFEPPPHHGSGRIKAYEKCRYYAKPKYDTDMLYNSSSGTNDCDDGPRLLKRDTDDSSNVYSEPLDVGGGCGSSGGGGGAGSGGSEYEQQRRHDLDRSDLERRSRSSWSNSGRRSTGRTGRKSAAVRAHTAGVHTLPNQDTAGGSMLVDENGFVRFRQLAGGGIEAAHQSHHDPPKPRKHHRHHHADVNHYSDA